MTAEVAILNTQGAAIAADSAVTIGLGSGENKIYYTAEKIFNISDSRPIGVMIYNSAEFMGINWKLILNEYSNKLTEKDRFKKLEDCIKNFIKFLADFEYEYMENKQNEYLIKICVRICSILKKYISDIYQLEYPDNKDDDNGLSKKEVIKLFSSALKKRNDELKNAKIQFPDFSGKFILSNTELVKNIAEQALQIQVTEKNLEELINLLIFEVKTGINGINYSGVVFVGYGDEEIFPSVCSVKVFGKLGVDLTYIPDEPVHIGVTKTAMIKPYAQIDVINTFICGIDPELKRHITENILPKLFNQFLENFNEEKTKNILAESLKEILNEFDKELTEDIFRVNTSPILEIVSSLPTINLAEMAESLINITSLRRHNSTDQDTVGGPTDVAIISKVDGFVWVKRKNTLSY